MKQDLLTMKEAAEYLRCHTASVWRRRKEGQILASKNGRKVLFARKELERFVKQNQEPVINGK